MAVVGNYLQTHEVNPRRPMAELVVSRDRLQAAIIIIIIKSYTEYNTN